MLSPIRDILQDRFKKMSKQITRQALSRGVILQTDNNKIPDFFAPHFDGVGQIEELRDVIRCLDCLGLDGTGSNNGTNPERERERERSPYREPDLF